MEELLRVFQMQTAFNCQVPSPIAKVNTGVGTSTLGQKRDRADRGIGSPEYLS